MRCCPQRCYGHIVKLSLSTISFKPISYEYKMEAVSIAEKQVYDSARHTASRKVSDEMMQKFMEQMAAECLHFIRPDSDFDPFLEPRTRLSKTISAVFFMAAWFFHIGFPNSMV